MLSIAFALSLAASATHAAEPNAGPAADPAPQAAVAAPVPAGPAQYNYKTLRLNRAALDALLAKPEQLLIIDVRRPDELTAIGGFPVYLNVQVKDLRKNLGFIPQNRTIVTVSNHAGRAGAAGDLLTANGFNVVGAIGAQDYEAEGGALTKFTPPPPRTAAASGPGSAPPEKR
jgi:rhodanese-related sulfurtransferase